MPSRFLRALACRPRRVAGTLFGAVAAVGVLAVASMALAKSFTLRVARDEHVTNAEAAKFAVKPVNTHEAVAVGPSGYAVYTFQGETTHHIICHKTTNASTDCWAHWPPVSPAGRGAVSKQAGISGKLGTFKNHGVTQLTLNGRPLYYFTLDIMSHNKRQANGDELKTFGSIWHIVKADPSSSAPGAATGTGAARTSTTPTTSGSPWG
jgi:predicted lipoprotein with Yx(FWY)xxD motif